MNSKTTFWGRIGAGGTAITSAIVGSAFMVDGDPQLKKILGAIIFIVGIVTALAKSQAGLAAADAEAVQPTKTEPPKQ